MYSIAVGLVQYNEDPNWSIIDKRLKLIEGKNKHEYQYLEIKEK